MKPAEDAENAEKKEENKEPEKKVSAEGEPTPAEGGEVDPEAKEKEEALKQPRMVSRNKDLEC